MGGAQQDSTGRVYPTCSKCLRPKLFALLVGGNFLPGGTEKGRGGGGVWVRNTCPRWNVESPVLGMERGAEVGKPAH